MHLAYSALRTVQKASKHKVNSKELSNRFDAYQQACSKYQNEIIAIQKHIPGWMPPFELKAQ